MIRIAINGFGRIGRNVTRALIESSKHDDIELVAINDLGDASINAHLLQYDTTHGRLNEEVTVNGDEISVGKFNIKTLSVRDPKELPWKELKVDIVLECTGIFTNREMAGYHLEAGAKKVLISAPGKDADATIVHGINSEALKASDVLVSNASCTTNCLAPIVKALYKTVGIEKGLANTVHAYTNDQSLIDVYHSDVRRARAAGHSMIPSKTGAAVAIGLVIPEMLGKLDGLSIRVPTINVSLLDFTFTAGRETSVEEINKILTEAAAEYGHVFDINTQPLVSSDFNHNTASSVADITQTRVIGGDMVKILAWYDNEWGFSNRMLDNVQLMDSLGY